MLHDANPDPEIIKLNLSYIDIYFYSVFFFLFYLNHFFNFIIFIFLLNFYKYGNFNL